ncbi:MAG: leucine-rich repeat domain-containing protein [Deltaproteobacteria bacterium]|nr:leucine-rich repeat domain-containing protein [Deltaproteobacteria bacterium]
MRKLAFFVLFFAIPNCARVRTNEREPITPYQAPLTEARSAEELSCQEAGNVWDVTTHKCFTRRAYCLTKKDAVWQNGKCFDKKEQCAARGDGSQWREETCISARDACLKDQMTWQNDKCQTSEALCVAKGLIFKLNEQGVCVLKTFRELCDDPELNEEAAFTLNALKEHSRALLCESIESWMQRQTSFRLVGVENQRKLKDLSLFIGFSNLIELVLENNSIEDLTPLASLTYLETLHLQNNEVRDLEPLRGLNKLKSLYLDRNKIIELSHLSDLTNLQILSLWDNRISSLTPLAKLGMLRELYLNKNDIGDVSPLKTLSKLERLSLDQNPIAIRENKTDANCPKEPWVVRVLRTFCID